MIADRIAGFRALLDARDRLAAGRDAAAQLAPAVTTLGEAAAELPPLAARLRLLREVGVLTEGAPETGALLRLVASLRERVAAAGEDGSPVPKQTLGRFRNLAEALRDALQDQTARAWAGWVGARTPYLSEDDLRLAEQTEGFAGVVAEVRHGLDDARRLAALPPDSAEAFAAARDALLALRRAVARLPDVSADPEVAAFLAAVAEGRATLAQVTPRVLDWLGQRGRADGFAVVRGPTPRPSDSDGSPPPQ